MRIRWTPAAATDLQRISDYLKQSHPDYRQPTMRKLYETIRGLKHAPHRGRPGCEEETRGFCFRLCHTVAVYRAQEQSIEVLRIYHTAQDRP